MEGEVRKSRAEIFMEHEEELFAHAARMRALSLGSNMGEKVGAAILLRDGTMLGGFNTPHASMCAEGTALLGFDGRRVADIVAIAVDGGESVCWNHLKGLRKGDKEGDRIVVLHREDDEGIETIETMTLDGKFFNTRGVVPLVSVNPVLP